MDQGSVQEAGSLRTGRAETGTDTQTSMLHLPVMSKDQGERRVIGKETIYKL